MMKFKSLLAGALLLPLPLSLSAAPQWIWTAKKASDGQKATFKKTFTIDGEVKSATLSVSCDNGADAILNGKKVFTNPDWMEATKADVKAALKAGENELRFDARNQGGTAALIAKLEIETADGKKTTVETGEGWQGTDTGKEEWATAKVLAPLGAGPWGDVFSGNRAKGNNKKNDGPATATPAEEIAVLPGFKAELLYTVPKAEQGSWVSMTVDPKGRLLVGDQYGGLYRVTVPPVGSKEQAKVEPLPVKIGGAHGLLYAFDSLYVMINEMSAPQNAGRSGGIWRLKDNGDGTFGEPEQLRKIAGGGEHGTHSMVVSPDGKSIIFNSGNHTKLPENMELSRPARAWNEDHILPRMWDANGHARGVLAPGGYICKMDPDGKKVELFCYGFRNQFDITFNSAGELFTFDADMEWDMGAPWYRPTRINHCVSGADYGWRSGSGKWPTFYPDSLPATADIGPGSPTGVVSGTGAKFPAKYQRAVYAADWTYGTMYVIHSTPKGGTYESVKEEFVSGKPLPLTDMIIHPQDGAMYFAVGGRRTQSALYRVTYVGSEATGAAEPLALTPEMKLRHDLEKLHEDGTGEDAIAKAWPHLSSPDRFVRYAARVAIERQPVKAWKDKALAEQNPQALIEASIALARIGAVGSPVPLPEGKPKAGASSGAVGETSPENVELQTALLAALDRIDFDSLDLDHQLQLLRAYELVFTRLGKPTPDKCADLAEKLDSVYPVKNNAANLELAQLLIFLESKRVVAKTLGLMATAKDDSEALASDALLARNTGYARAADEVHRSQPNRQQISYMFALRNATAGWTKESRETYFSWFPRARQWKGGNSFKGFIENTRQEALANFAPEEERAALDALSAKNDAVQVANFVAPKGPGRAYTIDEVLKLAEGGLKNRNFENGKAMFTSTLCLTCHRFGGDGGSIGPDVTGAGSRYTLRDLMENIIEPSKVISDQYDSHQIEKKDGSLVIGRIVAEENGDLMVMMNPFAPTSLTKVAADEVKSKKTQPVSMMPPGLINTLNQDELLDLIAYILSAGNPQDARFTK
ncbi:c-type cytochrome [Roseimicrobium gellanilyticum]|nr:c-type cytochrome [Roseimicrobium gellanilyticum]